MFITAIEMERTKNNQRQIADVAIILDHSLKINNIKLIDNGKKLFVEFSQSTRRESGITYPDVIPLTKKMRGYIEREIIREYFKRSKGGQM